MKTKKNTTIEVREMVLKKREDGLTYKQISQQLDIPLRTVGNICKKSVSGKPVADCPRSGRPKKTTVREDKLIVRKSIVNPRKTAVDIQREINQELGLSVSRFTVGRRLRAAGLNGRIPVRKPLISNKNRAARLRFARMHQHWRIADWKKILWSDESKFNLFGSDGKRYIRRPKNTRHNPRYQKPTVKHGGGSAMVWGCFHYGGVGPLVPINGIMDRHVYRDILQDQMLPFARRNMRRGWSFQQDNDPKHTSALVKTWFRDRKVKVLAWPSQSPDLNPIEHLWDVLGRRVGAKKHSSKADLIADLQHEWSIIPTDTIEGLIESMPRRCAAVIAAKGFATKY